MNSWHVSTCDPINDQELADKLANWLPRQVTGLRLFCEGATRSELTWADAALMSVTSLASLWLIRLFCQRFELYARRRSFAGGGNWQLRIIGPATELPGGMPVTPVGTAKSVMLLGKHTRNGEFQDVPNRYRRTRLRYPFAGELPAGSTCWLEIQRFQCRGASDGMEMDAKAYLSCWTGLRASAEV